MQWTTIYTHLKDKGVDVYSPGQHQGECTSPYVVIKDAGTLQYNGLSSTQTLYDIMCYVPGSNYSELRPFVEEIKGYMDLLRPTIMPVHYETPAFYDDSVKGHMISVQYRNMRKYNYN